MSVTITLPRAASALACKDTDRIPARRAPSVRAFPRCAMTSRALDMRLSRACCRRASATKLPERAVRNPRMSPTTRSCGTSFGGCGAGAGAGSSSSPIRILVSLPESTTRWSSSRGTPSTVVTTVAESEALSCGYAAMRSSNRGGGGGYCREEPQATARRGSNSWWPACHARPAGGVG